VSLQGMPGDRLPIGGSATQRAMQRRGRCRGAPGSLHGPAGIWEQEIRTHAMLHLSS